MEDVKPHIIDLENKHRKVETALVVDTPASGEDIFTAQNEDLPEEEQQEEVARCAESFKYFAETYVKITHPKRGLIPFRLYPYQDRCINDYDTYKHNIIRKFRQGGLTTLTVLWAMWRCMFKLDQKIMVLSKSDREATGAGKMVTNALKYLPTWLKPQMDKDNEHEKIFGETNGSIEFWTCEAARSKSLTYLIIDEAAFIKGMEEHWKSMYPTLATGGNCIVISTVNGVGNWYEEWYHAAVQGKNSFHVIDLNYQENPEYNNPSWVKEMRGNMGERGWKQEVLGDFLSSGETYIPGDTIIRIETHARHTIPIKKMFPEWEAESDDKEEWHMLNPNYEKGAMWVWEEPQKGEEYILSSDVAEGVGDGGDFSCFHVFHLRTMNQVAEFSSDTVPPHLFAQVIHNAATWYNNALVIVEGNGTGLAVLNKLQHWLYYDNIYYEMKGKSEKAGVRIDRINRPVFLEQMQNALINNQITMNSPRFVRELKTFEFSKTKKRAEARKGKHDDLIMALAIMLGVKDNFARELPPINMGDLVEVGNISKDEIFLKIKAEIEGGLVEDLLRQAEEKDLDTQDVEMISRLMDDDTVRRYRPYDKLLKEFGW
jgi:hypothetical protein